ncbi:MAG TPA: cell division protein FtsA, partial [bacterium]|nr:cell division protein FtsA [bacterium]
QRPTVIGVYTHPSKGVKRGTIVNIEEATDSISESVTAAEKMAGITVSDVYVAINGEQITSINNKGVVAVSAGNEISMEDTMRAIENAKTLSLPQNINPIHIIPREFVVDSQGGIKYPIGMTGLRLEVETHIITAPMSSWQNLVKCIQQLGLTVNDIVFTGWASSLAVLTDTEKELGVAMLDIGSGTTSVSIFMEGSITYSGCIPLGGQSLTSDIAIGLQVSLEDAEKIKMNLEKILEGKIGSSEENKTPALLRKKDNESEDSKLEELDDDKVDLSLIGISSKKEISKTLLSQIIDARLDEIYDMIRDNVSRSGYDINMPAGIVITGGTSQLQNVLTKAEEKFGVPVRVGYPTGLSGMTEEISDPSYSAVQGLIKHAMDDDNDGESIGSSDGGFMSNVGGIFGKVGDWIKSLLP